MIDLRFLGRLDKRLTGKEKKLTVSDAQGLAAGKTPKSVSNTVFVLFYSTQGFGGVDLLCSKISLGRREFFVVFFWVGIDIARSGGKKFFRSTRAHTATDMQGSSMAVAA